MDEGPEEHKSGKATTLRRSVEGMRDLATNLGGKLITGAAGGAAVWMLTGDSTAPDTSARNLQQQAIHAPAEPGDTKQTPSTELNPEPSHKPTVSIEP